MGPKTAEDYLKLREKYVLDLTDTLTAALQFSNECHDPDTGEFCETEPGTRWHGDYKMEYISPEMGSGLHKIVVTHGDTQVAQMSWSTKQIEGLDVSDQHQRKGIAKAMWEWGQTMRPKPKHSNDRTAQGDAWAKAMGGKLPRRLPEPPPFEYSADVEFSNTCHDPDSGEFCETPGAPGHEDHQGRPSYGTPSTQSMKDEEEAAGDEYRGGHQPPRYSVTIDDLTNARGSADEGGEDNQGMIFPDDVYTSPQYYTHANEQYDRESIRVIKSVKGKPDAPVKLYRGVPATVTEINKGDWVAISRSYAEQHAEGQTTDNEPWHVIEITAPANTVRNGGNDIIEWGYWGPDQPAKTLRASAASLSLSLYEQIAEKRRSRIEPAKLALWEQRFNEFYNHAHDEAGRFTTGEGGSSAEAPAPKTTTPAEIRDWARKQGLQVGDRGRLHPDIVAAWKKNQAKLAREAKKVAPVQPPTPTTPTVEPSKPSPDAMREWLRARNYPIGDRGRISQRYQDIYKQGNPEAATEPEPVKVASPETAFATKFHQLSAQLGPPEGWFPFPDSAMEAVNQGWRKLSGEPGDRSLAIASRVEGLGALVHDEITKRLEAKGIKEPTADIVQGLKTQRQTLMDEFKANGATVDILRDRMRQDDVIVSEEFRKMHGKSYFDATDEEQIAFHKELDKRYPGYSEAKAILVGHGEKIALLDNQIRRVDQDYSVAYGDTAREVLNEIRPFGNKKFEKVRGAQIKAVAQTGDSYPDDWVTESSAAGEIQVGTAKRGLHSKQFGRVWIPGPNGEGYYKEYKNSRVKIAKQPTAFSGKTAYYSNAVHEVGHRFEALKPHIRSVEWVLWHLRATGQSPQSLKALLPDYGYKADELTIKDDYVNPYMGKTYGAKSDSNYELFTMGMESLMSGSNPIWKDKQYVHHILGLLGAG